MAHLTSHWLPAAWLVCTGCGGRTTLSTEGEAGVLVYTATVEHFGAAPTDWDGARFALSEAHTLSVATTADGARAISEPAAVWHRLREGEGRVMMLEPTGEDDVPDVVFSPSATGTVWLEALEGGTVIEAVSLEIVAGRVVDTGSFVAGADAARW